MKKGTAILIGLASFSAGFALGVLFSPAKRGFGNNMSYHYYGDKWIECVGKEQPCCSDDDAGECCGNVCDDDPEEIGVTEE